MIPQQLALTDAEIMWVGVIAAVVAVVLAFVGYRIGRRKDRPVVGMMLGGLLAVPGLLIISLMPKKEPTFY